MNTFTGIKRVISLVLALIMVVAMMPVNAHAATAGRESDTIFFATDRHEESSKLQSLLRALQYTPGLVVLGGDHVNNTNSGSLASITSEIQSIYPGVQTFYTYAAHDPNVSEDSSNPYAYARTGEYYEGEDYYVYALDQNAMQSASTAATASANFKSWAATADSSKVIFVMCHMPIHSRRGDNAGGATWMSALNEVGQSHDIVYLWGHNHTGESSADTSVYFVGVGGSLTPQGGSTGTINFTYMNAGYIKNGYASMVVINNDTVDVTRYNTSGSATAKYSIERRFATSHTWEVTESVAATCETDGYETLVCTDCGETKTTVVPATGHAYSSVIQNTCTGSCTIYTCAICGHSYSEQNATETTYDQASGLTEGERYVIVASNYALTCGSSVGRTSVSVSNGSITSDVTDAMIWTYRSGKLYNEANGKYLTASSSKLSFGSSGSSVSYSSNKLKIGNYYLRYSSSAFSASRSSGSSVTLYQMNEAIGGTGEHIYEIVTVEATCTENGSVTYTCTACGYSYSETIAATGSHSYETVTVEATCTEDGSVTHTCTACGDTYTEVIPAAGHTYVTVVTAPTCTEQGFTTYSCACGDTFVSDYVDALGHSYEAVTVEATCTENGSVTYTCRCGDTYTEVIPAAGHTYVTVVTAPTCTEQGFTTYSCACGDTYVSDYVDALGHDYESVTVEATCEEAGYTGNTCTLCGDTTITDETPALGHSYESVTVEATCTTDGYTTYTCHCGHSYIADQVAALGHVNESVITEATCETAGYTTHTCTVCGEVTVDSVVAALGHDYVTVTVEATCESDGSVTRTCARCADHSEEVIPAAGHSYEAVVTAPTCTEDGYTTYTCASCGHSYTETAPALGHSYETVTVEVTCETDGSVTHTCANCGDSYTEITAALGHNYTAVVTEATCEQAGFTTHTCANCGHSYITDEVAAKGHSYTSVEENGYLVYTCECGHSYSEKLTATYTQVSAIAAGENYVITLYSGSRYYALSHGGNEIDLVQVSVSNGVITSEITDDLVWTYADGKLSYTDNGTVYYMYASSSSWWGGWFGTATLSLSTTNSSAVSFSSNKLKVGSSYYLRYSYGSVTLNRSASTAYLFAEE